MIFAQDGRPRVVIRLPGGAGPAERFAAEELQAHLRRITSADFQIQDSPGPAEPPGPVLLVGRTPVTERLLAGFDWNSLKEDGCLVKTVGNALILAGATPQGTLYAVYEFLDRVLGCRWLTPTCSVIPERKALEIGTLDLVQVPVFRYREPYFNCVRDADWAARNRANGAFFPLDDRHGGQWGYAGFVHTFYPLVPPEQYFATHPEFYSEINGQRNYVGAQLCLTNPELLEVTCQSVRDRLRAEPGTRVVSISQNDWNGWCRCARCRAIDDAEGSPAGTIVRFVNAVAERLEREFPQVYFDTLAYTYSLTAPRQVRPRPNVIIRICRMSPCCDAHPIEQCPVNRPFVDAIEQWNRIAPEIFIWDYYNNFHHCFQPFPNLDGIAADIPFYARNGVTGIFCQGDSAPTRGCGDMTELRAWLMARLLWNPELDPWQLVDEFLRLYYGPAAPVLREYLDLLHRQARRPDNHFHLYQPLESPVLAGDTIPRCEAIFDRAEQVAAHDPTILDRVQAARLPVDYMVWQRQLRFELRGDRYQPAGEELADRIRRFVDRAAAHGAQAIREGGVSLAQVRGFADGYAVVTITNDRLTARLIPAMGGRLVSLVEQAGGTEWMHWGIAGQSDYPFAGGYEEYSEHQWRRPGWREEFRVVSQTESDITLKAILENELTLQRTYRLEANAAYGSLRIISTLANPTAQRRPVCFRSMPEFDAGDFGQLHVQFRKPDGSWHDAVPWRDSKEPRDSRWEEGAGKPAGACAIVRGGRRLELRFESEKIEKVLFDWDRPLNVIRLGLNGTGRHLDPGAEWTIAQEWHLAEVG